MDACVYYLDMPERIKGFTRRNCDGSYTIVINSRRSFYEQQKTLSHELNHIQSGDFDSETAAAYIECEIKKAAQAAYLKHINYPT